MIWDARLVGFALLWLVSSDALAWFFIFPLPNVSAPPQMRQIVDALEKSSDTRALAFVSEDKAFGAKMWVWGQHAGFMSQEEANGAALAACERSLIAAKAKTAGGQPLYDFGNKRCELWPFTPNDGPKRAEEQKRAIAAEAERRKAVEDEAKRIADQRIAAEEEARRVAAQASARKAAEGDSQVPGGATLDSAPIVNTVAGSRAQSVDFNAEATKAARILGCQPIDLKVTGVEAGNIQYLVGCREKQAISLSCDPSGLCLQSQR